MLQLCVHAMGQATLHPVAGPYYVQPDAKLDSFMCRTDAQDCFQSLLASKEVAVYANNDRRHISMLVKSMSYSNVEHIEPLLTGLVEVTAMVFHLLQLVQ